MGENRRKSLRLPNYDYGQAGGYFITICTKGQEELLSTVGAGHLAGPVVKLTEIGTILETLILQLPQAYPTVTIDKYVIMPNHVHLLIQIAQSGPAGCPAPTMPKIIGALKSMTTRQAGSPVWQRGYYDHIIRDEADHLRIWEYIDTNPAKWEEDEYFGT